MLHRSMNTRNNLIRCTTMRRAVHLPRPATVVAACCDGMAMAAAHSLINFVALSSTPRRFLHFMPARFSVTGVAFSPVSPTELKMQQWLKQQEILARRHALHQIAESVWANHPREPWSR